MTSVNSIIAKFREPIFAAIDENGKIVRMPPGDEWHNHPLASKARWIGGTEDTDIVRAAFAMLTKLGSRGGILAIEWKSGADSALLAALLNARAVMISSVTGEPNGLTVHDIRAFIAHADAAIAQAEAE